MKVKRHTQPTFYYNTSSHSSNFADPSSPFRSSSSSLRSAASSASSALASLTLRNKLPAKKLPADDGICIDQQWLSRTKMLRYLELFDFALRASPPLNKLCNDASAASSIIKQLSSRSGHPNGTAALSRLYEVGDSKKRFRFNLVLAFLLLLKYDTVDGCWAVIERVSERVGRCDSAQNQAYVLVVQTGAHLLHHPSLKSDNYFQTRWDSIVPSPSSFSSSSPSFVSSSSSAIASPADRYLETPEQRAALARVHIQVEDYLDTHKENSFKSALHEPARFYYHIAGNGHHRDHVNVHGLNGWLCLIRGWFDCKLPILPLETDTDAWKGCSDIWQGLSDAAWTEFKKPENFGKDFGKRREGMVGMGQRCCARESGGGGFLARRS